MLTISKELQVNIFVHKVEFFEVYAHELMQY